MRHKYDNIKTDNTKKLALGMLMAFFMVSLAGNVYLYKQSYLSSVQQMKPLPMKD